MDKTIRQVTNVMATVRVKKVVIRSNSIKKVLVKTGVSDEPAGNLLIFFLVNSFETSVYGNFIKVQVISRTGKN